MDQRFLDERIETLPRQKIQEMQMERLRWQVSRCYEKSKFYRGKFERSGVRPSMIRTLKDLQLIPFTYKEELREDQIRYTPLGSNVLTGPRDLRELHPTTGTTGVPVYTAWSRKDIENIKMYTARCMLSFGVRAGDVIHNAFKYGLWVAGLSVHFAAEKLGCLVIPIGMDSIKHQLDSLVNLQPGVIIATPSYALYLARIARERGIMPSDLNLRTGGFGGEPGAGSTLCRERLEASLGIQAYDFYGLAEVGPCIASECEEKAGLHWCEDHHLVEVIDPDSLKPCAPGEMGVLVITDLTKEAMPMLRYWTNDIARLTLDRCGCGRTHARSPGGIIGRTDDLIMYQGAKFYPVQVEEILRRHHGCGEIKILLKSDDHAWTDHCEVLVETTLPSGGGDDWLKKVRADLQEELQAHLEVRPVPYGSLGYTGFKPVRVEDQRKKNSLPKLQ